MISALLLLTLAQTQMDPSPKWEGQPIIRPRVYRSEGPLRMTRLGADDYAFFEAFPSSGAGTNGVCSTTAPTGAKGETLTFTRASNGTCTKTASGGLATTGIANGDLVVLSSNQPRVEYDANGTLGLLVEGASTNGVLRSEEFDNAAWTTDASGATITVTANAATAPDGTSTAERVECQATSGVQLATRYSTAYTAGAVGNPWTCSAYVKGNGTSGTTDLCLYDGGAWACTACSFVSTSWTRCVVSDAAGASSTTRYCKFGNNSNQNGGTARSATDMFAWGFDGEEKAYATSYIPTVAATATRGAEIGYWATSWGTQLATGSMAASVWYSGGEADKGWLTLSAGDSFRTMLYQGAAANAVNLYVSAASKASTTTTPGQRRLAGYWSGSETGVTSTGTFTTGAGATESGTITRLRPLTYSGDADSSRITNGIISRICVDPDPARCR